MKKTIIVMVAAAGLAWQAVAAPENSPSASTHVRKNPAHQQVYPFVGPKVTPKDRIDRYGGISSRPWAQTVGWSSGPSMFAGDRERFHDVQFNLFWVGRTP